MRIPSNQRVIPRIQLISIITETSFGNKVCGEVKNYCIVLILNNDNNNNKILIRVANLRLREFTPDTTILESLAGNPVLSCISGW